ncbi:indolepyruvate ferredoxin oxidoreductase family protein [Rhodococcus jostii]|uniref:indolepyruvate ferredoxin oxidoreductase family protein n=1 Tax=Rhodococcus jostii TaxID=132919 RepID=UPI000935563B|nr:indolepyruvate ferredoxin oxidoreductase family protein [Rhodococcus jostii]
MKEASVSLDTTPRLDDRYRTEQGTVYLSGLQALVRLPLDLVGRDRTGGRDTRAFISGYEGSPLAGYDLELARNAALLASGGVVFQPGVNEELAANAVQGSQLAAQLRGFEGDGVIGIWYGKAPGLDRATDALRHANLGGAHPGGGALVIVGDDSVAKSSTVPSSSEIALAELGMPVLSPSDPQDILDLGVHGIEMSRASGLWVAVKIATNVADGSATVRVGPSRVDPVKPQSEYLHEVSASFVQPTIARLERSLFSDRLAQARRYAAANAINSVHGQEGAAARVGLIVAGSSYLDVRQALLNLGLTESELADKGVRLLKLALVHPLIPEEIRAFSDGLDELIVVEEKRSFIEAAIKDILYGTDCAPAVSGKTSPDGSQLLRSDADLTPEHIAEALASRLGQYLTLPERPQPDVTHRRPVALPLLARTPFFCSGCPHNRSTEVPGDSLTGAGMGCAGMVTIMNPDRVGEVIGLTQMGGEGALWIGASPFLSRDHMIQNMGDGTFHHSGSLAIRAAIASGANITFKVLYNSAVAMTGGQQAVGKMSVPAIAHELKAEGAARIIITTEEPRRYRKVKLPSGVQLRHRDDLVQIQNELAGIAGVTVVIHDQECATELRRKRKRHLADDPQTRVFINERACEGCGDCGEKSNCLSVQPVQTEYGRKTKIHQASCNKDYSCLDGDCPSFLSVTPGRSTPRLTAPDICSDELPSPEFVVPTDSFSVRITGIGGTGVVTIAQMLATAAAQAGHYVQALDQTGLAQKGGAVVSDVRISTERLEQANKIGTGLADLYLGCDVLVAADPANLTVATKGRTVAVVSTAEVPTGAMVTDTNIAFPRSDQTVDRIAHVTREGDTHFVDARQWTLDLFDDDQYANVLLLGVAYQRGALPLPWDAIETAIKLNGVAVERNLQAFRRGRQLVSDPDSLKAILFAAQVTTEPAETSAEAREIAGQVSAAEGSELARIVLARVDDLIGYQNGAYAQTYADQVEWARRAEEQVSPGSTQFTESVARYLYKLMAYKDEYEVARLCLDPQLERELVSQFGEGYRAHYRLHPPFLRALGMSSKLSLGPWSRPILAVLRAMRGLRGTWLDPFGYAKLRRLERELIREYTATIRRVTSGLAEDNLELAMEIAELPDGIRGYESIKMQNVALYQERLAERMSNYQDSQVCA